MALALSETKFPTETYRNTGDASDNDCDYLPTVIYVSVTDYSGVGCRWPASYSEPDPCEPEAKPELAKPWHAFMDQLCLPKPMRRLKQKTPRAARAERRHRRNKLAKNHKKIMRQIEILKLKMLGKAKR